MENKNGSWKNEDAKVIALKQDEHAVGSLSVTGLVASLGLIGLAALLWVNTASAAIARPGAEAVSWKKGLSGDHCEDHLSNLYLAGSFTMPGSGEPMNLWVGKPRGAIGETEKLAEADKEVWGLIGKRGGSKCEAQCKVTRFERFQKDLKPALMELDCEGTRIKTLRMPLHVQWIREKKGFETVVRLGSSIYGVEEAPLQIQVNRYAVAANK